MDKAIVPAGSAPPEAVKVSMREACCAMLGDLFDLVGGTVELELSLKGLVAHVVGSRDCRIEDVGSLVENEAWEVIEPVNQFPSLHVPTHTCRPCLLTSKIDVTSRLPKRRCGGDPAVKATC
jgi:hypothetical protein